MTHLDPRYWDTRLPSLAEALRELQQKQYCITTWGALLKVKEVRGDIVRVSDPDAIDAGQLIHLVDIKEFLNERPKQ